MTKTLGAIGLTVTLAVSACGSDDVSSDAPASVAAAADDSVADRIETLQAAVTTWASATTVEAAHAAAEAAANLVVGPAGPGYGDRDGDGTVNGASDVGLLSGLDGDPAGLAVSLAANECVTRDVLGATANDPADGWAEMQAAIDEWRPDNNTMPTLASHPMRVVGWATFTLASGTLTDAHEYAGHAQLHVDVARDALACS